MSKTTANFGLIKPELTDSADITQMNQNWDTIDAQLKTVDDRVTTVDNKFKNYATTKNVDDAIEQINKQLDGLSTDAGDLTGVLPIGHGGTGATTASQALTNLGASPSNHTHKYAGSSKEGGSATSAEKLATGRTIRTNLGSTSTASFDGTEDVTPGVTGTLPVSNGGTGATDVATAQSNLGIVPMNDIPNLYIWGKYTGNPSGYSLGTPTATWVGYYYSNSTTAHYSDTIEIVDGKIKPINAITISSADTASLNSLKGKFVSKGILNAEYYYVSPDATVTTTNGYINVSAAQKVNINSSEPLGYVASKENNTYPTNGQHSDGYWYVYSKQLGATEDPDYDYGTTDLTPGTSALETGKLYFVYE